MFGSTNSTDKKSSNGSGFAPSSSNPESNVTTVIAKGTTIEGKFHCIENVRLDGTLNGEVRVEKRFVMGDTGFVQGNIQCREASIKGKIKGDIHVKDVLHLSESAVIEGNISARVMQVDEGARYNGTCKIGDANKSDPMPAGNPAPAKA